MNVQHMQHDERFNNLILVSGILQVYLKGMLYYDNVIYLCVCIDFIVVVVK